MVVICHESRVRRGSTSYRNKLSKFEKTMVYSSHLWSSGNFAGDENPSHLHPSEVFIPFVLNLGLDMGWVLNSLRCFILRLS